MAVFALLLYISILLWS